MTSISQSSEIQTVFGGKDLMNKWVLIKETEADMVFMDDWN